VTSRPSPPAASVRDQVSAPGGGKAQYTVGKSDAWGRHIAPNRFSWRMKYAALSFRHSAPAFHHRRRLR
jgi:hypothetical protein